MKEINEMWHFQNWATLNDKLYGNTLSAENFVDDGRIHHQDNFFNIAKIETFEWSPENGEDRYFVKMVKGNEFFILPKKYLEHLPVEIKGETKKIKLKKSESQVWNYITGVDSSKVPMKKYFEFTDTIDIFNPVEHSDDMTWTFLKLMAFTEGIKVAICGDTGCGKNANLTLYRHIRGKVAHKIKNNTRAQLWVQMYYNNQLNFDEWTTWKKEHRNDTEDIIAGVADEDPDIDKFSRDKNRNLLKIKNINNKSFTFTFNPYSDNHHIHFKDTFENFDKIIDRYPILYLEGKVLSTILSPSDERSKQIVFENFNVMCKIIANDAYWKNNLDKHLHNYSRVKSNLNRRHLANLGRLLDVLDVYCFSQEQFDVWLVWIDSRIQAYKDLNSFDYSSERLA